MSPLNCHTNVEEKEFSALEFLSDYRENRLIWISVGQGAWERKASGISNHGNLGGLLVSAA